MKPVYCRTFEDGALVCPYCAHEHVDDIDSGMDNYDRPFECEGCGDRFMARSETTITYIGTPIDA